MKVENEEPFAYADFERARKELLEHLNGKPFYAMITGDSGTGKTTLLRRLASELDTYRFKVIFASQSNISPAGLVRLIARRIHISTRSSHSDTFGHLVDALKEETAKMVLLVDEAHIMPSQTLNEIRLLSESQLKPTRVLTTIICGLPELKARLDSHELFPLKRRIKLKYELMGLCSEELSGYIDHVFGSGVRPRFSRAALNVLFEQSRGVPAHMDELIEMCLVRVKKNQKVGRDVIDEVLQMWDVF